MQLAVAQPCQRPAGCRAFTAGGPRRQLRRQAAAALPVRAVVKTEGTTSGLEIAGMRPTSPKAWEIISKELKKQGVSFISTAQAEAAAKKGTTVIDVRPANEYKRGRIPGAVNCEFYRPITGWDPARIARRIGFAVFGVPGTEANPTFLEEVIAACPKKNGLILVCNIGGTLEPTGPSEFGRQSRSLTAAYELVQAGFKNIKVVNGGQNQWNKEERDVEVDG